jgi:hypothetical protein
MYLTGRGRLLIVVMRDRWPGWARPQLRAAVELAASTTPGRTLAAELYERWFSAAVAPPQLPAGPLVGAYRAAHASTQVTHRDGVAVLDRHDRAGADGWWRTWNTWWRPRHGDARVLLSPEAGRAPDLVGLVTARLREVPYLLACPSEPARLASSGAAVLHLARPQSLTPTLRAELAPLLRPDSPPLCLPVGPGIALAQHPDNGMSFGEHRCHLVALAFEVASGEATTLDAIAQVFAAHGVDPSAPYRS